MNDSQPPCHRSGHSDGPTHKCWSLENRILTVIDESELELSPIGIADKLREKYPDFPINHGSIRKFLRRLLEKGKLLQPYLGSYCNKITYGMRFVPLSIHNVSLRVCLSEDVVSWVCDEVVGGVKVHVCFGSERRKVSGYIANDSGMSKDTCLFAVHRWFDVAEKHLGRALPEPLELTTFEENRDFKGLRIDGVQCVTKKGLDGMIERFYQKEEGLVRAEHKVTKSMTITEFESLLQGGVTGYNQVQAQFALMQQVGQLTEALKFTNSRLLEIERQNQAFMKWIIDHNGKVG
jgi:hypothetical protein